MIVFRLTVGRVEGFGEAQVKVRLATTYLPRRSADRPFRVSPRAVAGAPPQPSALLREPPHDGFHGQPERLGTRERRQDRGSKRFRRRGHDAVDCLGRRRVCRRPRSPRNVAVRIGPGRRRCGEAELDERAPAERRQLRRERRIERVHVASELAPVPRVRPGARRLPSLGGAPRGANHFAKVALTDTEQMSGLDEKSDGIVAMVHGDRRQREAQSAGCFNARGAIVDGDGSSAPRDQAKHWTGAGEKSAAHRRGCRRQMANDVATVGEEADGSWRTALRLAVSESACNHRKSRPAWGRIRPGWSPTSSSGGRRCNDELRHRSPGRSPAPAPRGSWSTQANRRSGGRHGPSAAARFAEGCAQRSR